MLVERTAWMIFDSFVLITSKFVKIWMIVTAWPLMFLTNAAHSNKILFWSEILSS